MSKHAKDETVFSKFDRLIAELQTDGTAYGCHRADTIYVDILPKFRRERLQMWPVTFNRGPRGYRPPISSLQQAVNENSGRPRTFRKNGKPFIIHQTV